VRSRLRLRDRWGIAGVPKPSDPAAIVDLPPDLVLI